MRTVGSLILAIVGALAFSIAADQVAGAVTSSEPSWEFLGAGIFLLIAGGAFFFALAMRGPRWAIVLPCGTALALAMLDALLGDPHARIIAASTLALTYVMAGLGRLRTEASIVG
jgi:hypothetical protein